MKKLKLPELILIAEDWRDTGDFPAETYRAAMHCRERQLMAALKEIERLKKVSLRYSRDIWDIVTIVNNGKSSASRVCEACGHPAIALLNDGMFLLCDECFALGSNPPPKGNAHGAQNHRLWLTERRNNCLRLAAAKSGSDRERWLADAKHFTAALALK